MENQLKKIVTRARQLLDKGSDPETVRVKFLGRKSELTEILKNLKSLPANEKKKIGAQANQVKKSIEEEIANAATKSSTESYKVDLSLPALEYQSGSIHPIRLMQQEALTIFKSLGFSITTSPEIESDWYNFESLNIDEYHPARDDQDSFYIDRQHLLRVQTTAFQLRILEKQKPPIRVLNTGKVFRRDELDVTHTPTFHQLDGLIIDERVTFSDLKGLLTYLAQKIFTPDTKTRFRISYFPFVEPGAEMDISCSFCGQKDPACSVCKGSGWIEILGCGMVHPKILARAGLSSKTYQGLAFGMGIERLFMIKYQVPSIKLFYENDLRFLGQFSS